MDTSLTSTGRTEAVALSTQGVEPVLSMPGGLPVESSKSYLVRQDGHVFAGTHILADLWHGVGLDNAEFVESALREAADYADATVLHVYVHRFGEGDGISGVAVLAESHISIHTWPESVWPPSMSSCAEPADLSAQSSNSNIFFSLHMLTVNCTVAVWWNERPAR